MNNTESHNNYGQNLRPEMVDFLPSEYIKVLEVGCWKGDFRDNLHRNCEYWGVELNEAAAQVAKEKSYKIICGDFIEVENDLPDDYFDLIICNDVIEHMPDHDLFLEKIKNKLNDNGVVVGSIPNVRFIKHLRDVIFKKDWKYKDAGLLDKTHLRWFTEKSLKRTISHHGYTIEEFDGINSIFQDAAYSRSWFIKLMVNVFGKDTQFLQFAFRIKKSH